MLDQKEDVHRRLGELQVEDVWGIGRRTAAKLKAINVNTAMDFSRLPKQYVKKQFTIVGEKTWLELHGVDCDLGIPLDVPRQSMSHSRTFGKCFKELAHVSEAVSSFTSILCEKLRAENLLAGKISVFISGNYYDEKEPYYSNSDTATITYPTNSTIELTHLALEVVEKIFRDDRQIKRACVMVSNLSSAKEHQLNLFNPIDEAKHQKLSTAIDLLNRKNQGPIVKLASSGTEKIWKPKMEFKSREYTTCFKGIIRVNCC